MKKIFAIALALVMVLSMASAFAMNCLTVDWSTTTNCGTGSVEVVPYVLGNKAGGGNTYKQSDCAAAVNNQPIYYAVKVIVDENPNAEWWLNATLKMSKTGLAGKNLARLGGTSAVQWGVAVDLFGGADDVKAGTYYLGVNGRLTDTFSADTCLFYSNVEDADGAKVCAKIESSAKAKDAAIEINGAKVKINGVGDGDGMYNIQVDDVYFTFEDAGKFLSAYVNGYTFDRKVGDVFYAAYNNATIAAYDGVCDYDDEYDAIVAAMAAINITWGQKISATTAQAKLQWEGKAEDCATWNDEAFATVNAECQVLSIPKTGDKSVLAWLF